jgi:hypothetical protein
MQKVLDFVTIGDEWSGRRKEGPQIKEYRSEQ